MNKKRPISMLNYIGSKARMAAALELAIPSSCSVYAEPFCGSAALAINTPHFDKKYLNDYNPHISNFWRVATAQKKAPALIEAIKSIINSKTSFEEFIDKRETFGANRLDDIEWAAETFFLDVTSFNGQMESWKYTEYMHQCYNAEAVISELIKQKFVVSNMSAEEFFDSTHILENEKAFIFADPPYLEGLRSDGLYAVDMPGVEDHIDLLNKIKHAKANIMLCGYWSGYANDLYDSYLIPCGWHRHLLGVYTKGCDSSEEKAKGFEWIWTNYDLPEEFVDELAVYNADEEINKGGNCYRNTSYR